MSQKYLMLTFPDNREVFTSKENEDYLSEFIKNFKIKTSIVEADIKPKNIKDIAKIFCDKSYDTGNCVYRTVLPELREKILKKALDVRSYIESEFTQGNVVRIKELHKRFQKHNIAVSTLYRHVNHVKTSLKSKGHKITKISAGCYKILD